MEESKIRKVLFNEVSLAISIATAVFFALNYINSPINKMELDIQLMKKDIANISEQHTNYSTNAAQRDNATLELGKKIDRLITILETKGIIDISVPK